MTPAVPEIRVRALNDAPIRGAASYVLYWMVAARRTRWNLGLQRAAWRAATLDRPLVILEALRVDYPWASRRLHRFALDGMVDNARALERRPVTYHAWVERRPGEGRGLLRALAEEAAVVVTDDYPAFFLPRMLAAAARGLPVRVEAVDGNGLLPMADTERPFPRAHSFRRHLHARLPGHLAAFPEPQPLAGLAVRRLERLPSAVVERWPSMAPALRDGRIPDLSAFPLDAVVPEAPIAGGPAAGHERLHGFLAGLDAYLADRNQPSEDATSGLSPYLHWGHLGAHEVFAALARREGWSPSRLASRPTGSREGWWGMSPAAEAFVDQLVTWRELGFNACWHWPDDYARYERLPDWARKTLAEHAADPRPHRYDRAALEEARTHDPIWNAAQRQLRAEGRIHNYLRMLWGKKILEWSASPPEALETMLALNDRWALDGRDPNSASGILWCLGRYDRAWGPERPIFGKIRYMSSDNAARKLRLKPYLARWGPDAAAPRG